ncbi:protein kinase [Hypoxylon trugodes]|uniref:protein kinase n=1 Tax=Hypoxylon trugodes TaxID=326681 RepID=UPI0021A0B825|nr:protein kinase [Hypoxylon trugodes]KAI1393171.1 protein kinase [Hypoxylon trugodes]
MEKPLRMSTRLKLDDPTRVEWVHDRGESFSRSPMLQSRTSNKVSGDAHPLLKKIQRELDHAHVNSGLDSTKAYIPRSELPRILTPERVRTILDLPGLSHHWDKDRLAAYICFGTADSSPCLKLLAVLIGIGIVSDLLEFINEGVDDKCLPMVVEESIQGMPLYCERHQKQHDIVNKDRRLSELREFAQWSYALVAPYLRCGEKRHLHYVLDTRDVFPATAIQKVQNSETAGLERGIATNMVPPIINAYGGFSEVYRVGLDMSHYDFGNVGMRHPLGFFALKKLTSHNRENFNLELSSLLFSRDNATSDKANRHLIQLLATFEVVDRSTGNSTFYLLFDWAEGNLSDFWRTNERLVGNMNHCKWMAEQFHEISLALQCVHNERLETLKTIDQDTLEKGLNGRDIDVNDLYGRHGDIKPDNFLWFRPKASLNHLALSDFGLGRLHTQVSRSKQNPRDLTWTATYRAPEFDLPDGMISRASDIFSLGCVFLEHISWFLLGIHSVENDFSEQRSAKDIHDFLSDTFFSIEQGKGNHRPILKSSVRGWISELQRHKKCSWYLHQLLEIIRDKMLEPDREKRINVLQLIRDMEKLRKTCERTPSFYLKAKQEE